MVRHLYDTKENNPQQYYWFKEGLSKQEVGKVIALASELPEAQRAVSYTHLTLPTNREV